MLISLCGYFDLGASYELSGEVFGIAGKFRGSFSRAATAHNAPERLRALGTALRLGVVSRATNYGVQPGAAAGLPKAPPTGVWKRALYSIAVAVPIPSAKVNTAVAVNAGRAAQRRMADRRSRSIGSFYDSISHSHATAGGSQPP